MHFAVVNTKAFETFKSLREAPWILFLSMVLLVCFLVVAFVNLSMVDENSPKKIILQFSSLTENQANGSLFDIIDQTRSVSIETSLRTHLNETPYWIYANLPSDLLDQHNQIYFMSRHFVHSSCWLELPDNTLEQVALDSSQGRMLSANLRGQIGLKGVLCQFKFIGPASLAMGLQTQSDFNESVLIFERRQGFLEGVLYLMIGIVAVVAIMARSSLFVAYGFWLFASLRLVALSEGWDHILFGVVLNSSSLTNARMIALAMYFTSTVLIIWHLFDNIRRSSWRISLFLLQSASVILISLAFFSSYRTFLQLFWPVSLVASVIVAWVVIQYFYEKRDRVAVYYLASMMVTLTGAVAEVLSAWFDQGFLIQYFNSASVTVLASVMTAVALGEYLRNAQFQQQLAAQQVQLAHERLERVFDIAPSAMFTCSNEGNLLNHNKLFTDLFLNQQGKPIFEFLQPQRLSSLFTLLEQPGKLARRELPVTGGDGHTRWFELVVSRDHRELVGVVSDFTSRKDKELALQYQATHDELTGALNRRGLQNSIHNKLIKNTCSFVIFCIDIQKFSRFISAFGVSVSDELLQAFQTELNRYMSMHGDIARLHVDKFVVLSDINSSMQAEEAFDAFLHRVETLPFQLQGRTIQTQILATLVYQGVLDNVIDIMETIEVSMREAKLKAKRNTNVERIVIEQNQARFLLDQSRTIRGLDEQKLPPRLMLAWQPILALDQVDAPLYAEALLRIKGEDGKLNSAGFLLEACERSGHTAFLDSWVLGQSLDFLTKHAKQLEKLSVLSINVSPGSLNDDVFLQNTLALIHAHREQASKLCLEITEVGSVLNLQSVQNFIEQVRTLGVRIALDDFGAGYSNFRYAIDLHADVIKIDGSIIKNICHSTESHAVTAAVVGLAHDLGCKCVAEWVEDLHTLRAVKELGIDYIQGYLVSPAIDCESFLGLSSPLDLVYDKDRARLIQELVDSVPC
jgi:diguanylate cyclase (GGDEF)-like protein